ncbi:hypothetical protein Q8A73_018316 [Channa argus]|nr:hypothetical protein Q8A73_018316 [Channa argus]
MDQTSSTACLLSQRGPEIQKCQKSPNSWASSAATFPLFNGDQVWLEELIGPSSNQSSTSQPSSPSAPICSPQGSRSSSEGTGSLYSWSSGVTGLLHSSIKKQSQEAFQIRLRDKRRWGNYAACHSRGCHPQVEQGGDSNHNKFQAWPGTSWLCEGRSSSESHASAESVKLQLLLEERIQTKLKFSQFLDEVTSNVLDPNCLQAFGRPAAPSSSTSTNPDSPEGKIPVVTQRSPRLSLSAVQHQDGQTDRAHELYLETNIDTVKRNDEKHDLDMKAGTTSLPQLEIDDKAAPQFWEEIEMTSPFLEFDCDLSRYPNRSASLPKGINMVPEKEMKNIDTISCCCCWSGVVALEVAAVAAAVVAVGWRACAGGSPSFKGELGKPIQIAY